MKFKSLVVLTYPGFLSVKQREDLGSTLHVVADQLEERPLFLLLDSGVQAQVMGDGVSVLGQAISDHLCSLANSGGDLNLDPHDARNIDEIVEVVLNALGATK